MDNQDKLYKQFQNASQKAPEKDFPSMDKVWGRVEEKLDKKALTKENNLWKKIAVAASVLLVVTLGSEFLRKENSTEIITKPENEIVIVKNVSPEKESTLKVEETAITEKTNAIIKENATEIIEAEIGKQQNYAVSDEITASSVSDTVFTNSKNKYSDQKDSKNKNIGYFNKKIQAVGVERIQNENNFLAKSVNAEQVVSEKQSPLYVINGKAITTNKNNAEALLKSTDIDSIEILTEPLYIINGVEYSEEQLFGPNPTSPYAPLNKQKILSTKILLGEEATSIYGEKGKKGVVIISTKNSKPLD